MHTIGNVAVNVTVIDAVTHAAAQREQVELGSSAAVLEVLVELVVETHFAVVFLRRLRRDRVI